MGTELNPEQVESLAAEFHRVYQQEARRQGDVRHSDDYESLPENVKEFDRVLARHVLLAQGEALAAAQRQNERLRRELRNAMPSQYPLERTVIRSRAEHPGGEQ